MKTRLRFVAVLLTGLLISINATVQAMSGQPADTDASVTTTAMTPTANTSPVPSLAPMLQTVLPGVVNIATAGRVQVQNNPLLNDPFFRHFFSVPERPRQKRSQSIGSGVIVDADQGYILTNHHVIDNADEIYVILKDDRKLKAKLVGSDPETDIAVLKVKDSDLTAIPFGDSEQLQVGDFAVAIGNPFGLGQTVTSGMISALGRSGLGIEGYENFIQTDASINPGNSGGALVSLHGQLIGINSAIIAPSGGNVGIGFAIPINMARQVMEQLIQHGDVQRGLLGVQVQDLTPELADAMNLDQQRGALVAQVTGDSPADKAGIRTGDVIIAVDGRPVKNASLLRNRIGLKRLSSIARIELLREGQRLDFKVKIRSSESVTQNVASVPLLTGAELAAIPSQHPLYRQVEGVMVRAIDPSSPAASTGLQAGDIILSANRRAVRSVSELIEIAGASPGNLLLHVQRGNGALYLLLR